MIYISKVWLFKTKRAKVAILLSNKVDFKTRKLTKIKRINYGAQKLDSSGTLIVNVHAPNHRASKYVRIKKEMKEVNQLKVTREDFDTPHSVPSETRRAKPPGTRKEPCTTLASDWVQLTSVALYTSDGSVCESTWHRISMNY